MVVEEMRDELGLPAIDVTSDKHVKDSRGVQWYDQCVEDPMYFWTQATVKKSVENLEAWKRLNVTKTS